MYDNNGCNGERRGTNTVTPTGWLHLAATPTFVLMALVTGVAGEDPMDMLCPVAHGMSPLGEMTVMYLLMAVFHAAPWLKWASRWWRRGRGNIANAR